MIKVTFLINPISGKSGNKLQKKEIEKYLHASHYFCDIQYSSSKENLEFLTKRCIQNSVDIIVAVGGDGTINTIAKHLINTDIVLGILPKGSGNGIANHLRIKFSLSKLCDSIKKLSYTKIDCGIVNDIYFFLNFALGYPADVIHKYDNDINRGLITYIKYSITSFFNKSKNSILYGDSKKAKFSVLVSNTKYLGYNFSLTPDASINDGKLNLIYADSRGDLILKMIRVLLFKENHDILITDLKFDCKSECKVQIDGEPLMISPPFNVTIKKECLKVLIF